MCFESDDALSIDEWVDLIENEPRLDRIRFKPGPGYFFILCSDEVVMIAKDYYMLLLSDS